MNERQNLDIPAVLYKAAQGDRIGRNMDVEADLKPAPDSRRHSEKAKHSKEDKAVTV